MNCSALRASLSFRAGAVILVLSWLIQPILPAVAGATDSEETIYHQWEEVSSLRARGEFDRAIEILAAIVQEAGTPDGVLRRAYNHLVFTHHLKKDPAGAAEIAGAALERFPDLVADPVEFPPKVNETYEDLRGAMFGSLSITKPSGGKVFLDGEERGEIPLVLEYVPVGEHELSVTKTSHGDHAESIRIEPGVRHSFELSLERQRDARWWVYRIGPAVVAAAALVIALGGGDKKAAEEENPLPGPPDPPAR